MENKELKKVLTYLSEAYSTFGVTAAKFAVWQDGIGDINPEVVFKAVKEHIRESKYPPSIAEIRNLCMRIIDPYKSADDAWNEVLKAIRDFGSYRTQEATVKLDPIVIQALSAAGGYSSLCAMQIGEMEKARARFEVKYNKVKRENIDKLLSSSTNLMLEGANV